MHLLASSNPPLDRRTTHPQRCLHWPLHPWQPRFHSCAHTRTSSHSYSLATGTEGVPSPSWTMDSRPPTSPSVYRGLWILGPGPPLRLPCTNCSRHPTYRFAPRRGCKRQNSYSMRFRRYALTFLAHPHGPSLIVSTTLVPARLASLIISDNLVGVKTLNGTAKPKRSRTWISASSELRTASPRSNSSSLGRLAPRTLIHPTSLSATSSFPIPVEYGFSTSPSAYRGLRILDLPPPPIVDYGFSTSPLTSMNCSGNNTKLNWQ